MKVGDILVYSYNYNACYPHFVRVTRTTEKSVWLEEIPKKWIEHDGFGQNGERMPDFSKDPIPMKGSFRIKNSKVLGHEYVKVDGRIATPWNGMSVSEYTD